MEESLEPGVNARLSTAIVLFHSAVAEAVGLNLTDYKCLELLLRKGLISPGQLSTEAGLSSATTTLVLDRLANKGLLERGPDPSDRRKVIVTVTLTNEFNERFQAATGDMITEMAMLFSSFSAQDRSAVNRYVEGAADILERRLHELKG